MKLSLWQSYNKHTMFDKVKSDISTDILIIGAGLTGVSLAYNLIDSGYKVTLIDRGIFFNEVTAKTTAKITYLQGLKYQNLYKIYGYDIAKKYYDSQKEAINIIRKNIKDNNINCDLKLTKSISYSNLENTKKSFNLEKSLLYEMKVKYFTSSKDIKEYKNLVGVNDTYVFNPIKYLIGLLNKIEESSNIECYENSIAHDIKLDNDTYKVKANDNIINAKRVVLACNYPFFTLPGLFPIKTYMEKSYINASKVDDTKNIAAITSDKPVISFRYYTDEETNDKYLIFLSDSDKVSNKLNYKSNYDNNIKLCKEINDNKIVYKWTNTDVMTSDYLPLIGLLSKNYDNLYISSGYNTWGMTNATIGAKILFDLINNKNNEYSEMFSPTRKLNVTNVIKNTVASNVKAYSLNLIKKNPSWYKNKALVTTIDNKRVGIYYDGNGVKHVVSNICPHLKCFLTFNEVDRTWDCPCHASRYDIYGNSIKGPSCYNIKIDETK